MITACVLNQDSPHLLKNLLLPSLEGCELIDEIIVSHGREETVFDYESDKCRLVHRYEYGEVNDCYGRARCWLSWRDARNEAVLMVGEDRLLPEPTIRALYAHFCRDPEIIHSVGGRGFAGGEYVDDEVFGEVPVGRAAHMLVPRALGDACLERMGLVKDFVDGDSPKVGRYWEGEDIFASLVCMHLSGRMNAAYDLPTCAFSLEGASTETSPQHHMFDFGGALGADESLEENYRGRLARLTVERLGLGGKINKRARCGAFASAARKFGKRGGRKFRDAVSGFNKRAHVSPTFCVLGGLEEDALAWFDGLARHPKVSPPAPEVHGAYCREYEPHQRIRADRQARHVGGFPRRRAGVISGERCAAYLYAPGAAHRLREAGVDKHIVVLRDPAERAVARFLRFCGDGDDDAFNATLDREEWCLENGLPPLLSGLAEPGLRRLYRCGADDEFPYSGYYACLGGGRYSYWLRRWFHYARPERVMVVDAADLSGEGLSAALEFLGLEADAADLSGAGAPDLPALPSERTRERLEKFFARDRSALEELKKESRARWWPCPTGERRLQVLQSASLRPAPGRRAPAQDAPVAALAKRAAGADERITVCILNYRRSRLLNEVLLPAITRYRRIDEIIISHALKKHAIEFKSDHCRIIHRHDYGEVNDRYGLARRWLCWKSASNKAVLSLDEDMFLSEEVIEVLFRNYRRAPDIIHSIGGRGILPGFRYSRKNLFGDVPIAHTARMMFSRELGERCLEQMPLAEEFVGEESHPHWNGEDIFASFVGMKYSGRLNRSHCLPVWELDLEDKPGITRLSDMRFEQMALGLHSQETPWRLMSHDKYRGVLCSKLAEVFGLHEMLREHIKRFNVPRDEAPAVEKAKDIWVRLQRKTHVLPRFYVTGGLNSDAHALFDMVAKHPRVWRPAERAHGFYSHETFFDALPNQFELDVSYYGQFPWRVRGGVISGEYSSEYFYTPMVLHRVSMSPVGRRRKFIVVLRDEVERAYLRFLYGVGADALARGEDAESARDGDLMRVLDQEFNATLDREEWYLNNGLPELFSGMDEGGLKRLYDWSCGEVTGKFPFAGYYACLGGGRYAYWMRRLLRQVPPDSVMTVRAQRLHSEPEAVADDVLRFVGLGGLRNGGVGALPAVPQATPATRERLQLYFEPAREEMKELRGEEKWRWTCV